MNENLAVTLGELQAQIYWLHDAEKFTELALAAANIYKILGYIALLSMGFDFHQLAMILLFPE
ncbi:MULTISPECIES: hypothetical protein [unclassified Coleofasciculus]|uniref:hypothetical protein n=1 Tax=unclassified Coleofasciculus TaxID=2692782 RepID=UPI001D154D5A|nr:MULTISPECIES: hypothetical protein [unclassified Coleofasciculus]